MIPPTYFMPPEHILTATLVVLLAAILASQMEVGEAVHTVLGKHAEQWQDQYDQWMEQWVKPDPRYRAAVLRIVHFSLETIGILTLVHSVIHTFIRVVKWMQEIFIDASRRINKYTGLWSEVKEPASS